MNMHFLHAECLLTLLGVIPVVLALLYAADKARTAARSSWGEARLVDRYTRQRTRKENWIAGSSWTLAAALLVVAMSGPVLTSTPDKVPAGSAQVVAVMDVSKSMGAEPYRGLMPGSPPGSTVADGASGSNLEMGKQCILQIMQDVQGNPVGIVTYTGEGFAQPYLTPDHQALRYILKNFIKIGKAPGFGSDYASGLRQALAVFKADEDKSKTRVIVLLSDGGFTGKQEDLQAVLRDIMSEHIHVIVIGLGSTTPETIPQYNETTGEYIGAIKRAGTAVTTTIDELPLQQLAATVGGEYHAMRPGQTQLNIHWAQTLSGTTTEPQLKHIYGYFLAAAFVLLFGLSLSGFSRKRDVL